MGDDCGGGGGGGDSGGFGGDCGGSSDFGGGGDCGGSSSTDFTSNCDSSFGASGDNLWNDSSNSASHSTDWNSSSHTNYWNFSSNAYNDLMNHSDLFWHTQHVDSSLDQSYSQSNGRSEKKRRNPIINSIIIGFPEISKEMPTIVPYEYFDPEEDAKALRLATKGFFSEDDAIFRIILRRSNKQRQITRNAYAEKFGRDLIADIRSKTSGNFNKLLVALMTPIDEFYARELHDALSNHQNYIVVMNEVLCSSSNNRIHSIKRAYERIYGKRLETDLKNLTSTRYKNLLTLLLAGERDESETINEVTAETDARHLLTTESEPLESIEEMFSEQNFAQIQLIFEKYHEISGHSLETDIRRYLSSDFASGLLSILQCSINSAAFFATRLHASIPHNVKQTIRLFATRSEVDMNDIKMAYERIYRMTLRSWIKENMSNKYKHALYIIIGEQRSDRRYQ